MLVHVHVKCFINLKFVMAIMVRRYLYYDLVYLIHRIWVSV